MIIIDINNFKNIYSYMFLKTKNDDYNLNIITENINNTKNNIEYSNIQLKKVYTYKINNI
jgi:hypothetical protein